MEAPNDIDNSVVIIIFKKKLITITRLLSVKKEIHDSSKNNNLYSFIITKKKEFDYFFIAPFSLKALETIPISKFLVFFVCSTCCLYVILIWPFIL